MILNIVRYDLWCIFIILGIATISNSKAGVVASHVTGFCKTEDGFRGSCVPLKECPELQNFIKFRSGFETPDTANYLKSRMCRIRNRNVQFCCISKTPSNQEPPDTIPVLKKDENLQSILPSFDDCGSALQYKLVGGTGFQHGEHPWLVGLGHYDKNGKFKVLCGGTLITKIHVLTASHCFPGGLEGHAPLITHVILGEHNLAEDEEEEKPIIRRIFGHKNPGYNSTILYKDIELVTLDKDVAFTTYILPACLPSKAHVEAFDFYKYKPTVVGWGSPDFGANGRDKPHRTALSLISKSDCKQAYNIVPHIPLDDTQICFGGKGADACQGDGGGPLIYRDDTKFFRSFVIGIVSFGIGCGNPRFPGVYTYVPEYYEWILQNL